MMTDPIADMLTRIRNATVISKKSLTMPASKAKVGIANVLMQEGFIASYEVKQDNPSSKLELKLKYGPDGEFVIRHIKRISKPGCRVYSAVGDLQPVLRGMGIHILSTPKGILSDREARAQNVGGEILCEVY